MSETGNSAGKELYPLKFEPIYQNRIWGGTLMTEVLGRDVPSGDTPVGEAWELSDRDGAVSVVRNGALKGCTIREIIARYRTALTGEKISPDGPFPWLVKLIDAGERLSLQVHPGEELRSADAEPKTEMWYIVSAREDARILAGLAPDATRRKLEAVMASAEAEQLLQIYASRPGDVYFIPSGTLHAIGGGNLILEIQQNSDTTYRISDWGRLDAKGNPRALHVEKGLQAIDFTRLESPRLAERMTVPGRSPVVPGCPHFKVDTLYLDAAWVDDTASSGVCHLLSIAEGSAEIRIAGKDTVPLNCGETALIPFACGKYEVVPVTPGGAIAVKTYL